MLSWDETVQQVIYVKYRQNLKKNTEKEPKIVPKKCNSIDTMYNYFVT